MEKPVADIFDSLQKLHMLHCELLEACRLERVALVEADLPSIQELTLHKQAIVDSIRTHEAERMNRVGALAMAWKTPARELSLPQIIASLEARGAKDFQQDSQAAEKLQGAFSALKILIDRITEANEDNRRVVERSLEHVEQMKRNVLGEAVPKSNTYTAQGQRQAQTSGARLFNKEA